ncbi:MAG: acyl-CoA dehydrogenase [Alphaproteobacteria bacterium]|nr:acyl-CoA dehydrogenase [Alphaproteobacteria bacterium]MBU1515419.1 acyl-CoA dehydrogenase [Alphaproteobacteria bacterium]MBU2092946.1 acyl-CoA dehydrogenase [Alphaproteobacteria bacterium]MBU2154221.1 acyl-CoA dehydrogenase [Alphaproteobacteria bacterium]MBU2307244.1 acyl-CoA dehydrogenase [Alphaproteobacteria bacterium]
MDMTFDDTQTAIKDSCDRLFGRMAGPARARALGHVGGADLALAEALEEAGFLDLFAEEDAGPLVAALITEWAAKAAALVPVGARTLVAPTVIAGALPQIIAVCDAAHAGPVRYAAQADVVIQIDGDAAVIAQRGDFTVEPVASIFGYPMARISGLTGVRLGAGSGEAVRRWWQVALAAEIAGTARAALDQTIAYLQQRVQFGRQIASFQAVQHRLVDCHVSVESTAWAAREAAARGAPAALAAGAAITAVECAQRVFDETHQLSGAIGFTTEYDLYLWSMRLQTLRQECGGIRAHASALVASAWT